MDTVGARNKRVRLQRRQETSDGSGGSTTAWVDVDVLWARVSPGSGREFWQQKHLSPELSHIVNIRYRSGLLPTMRFLDGARAFRIVSVRDPEERHIELDVMCEEYVPT